MMRDIIKPRIRLDCHFDHLEDCFIYSPCLEFCDFAGRSRRHAATFEMKQRADLSHHLSFTAASSVDVRSGIVRSVKDQHIEVVELSGECKTWSMTSNKFRFATGERVHIIERLGLTPGTLNTYTVVPHYCLSEPSLARIQSVNVDIVHQDLGVIFRLSADPFVEKEYHGSRMET